MRRTYQWDGTKAVEVHRTRSIPKAPAIIGDYKAYDCPITGKLVEGRAAHRENLKRHQCRVYEKGETRDSIQNKEREADAVVERIVDQASRRWAATDYDTPSDEELLAPLKNAQ